MELQVVSTNGQDVNKVSVSDKVFGRDPNEALVHQVMVAYRANGRAGTRAQKSRSDVRGGGAKPWRQKGTGRARAGTSSSPIWQGGGVTFAARPQDHSQKINKKMYRAAMSTIFSELLRQDRLRVVDELNLDQPKTRLIVAQMAELSIAGSALLVTVSEDRNLSLASRNLPGIEVSDVAGLDPIRLIHFDQVVITMAALERVGEWLA